VLVIAVVMFFSRGLPWQLVKAVAVALVIGAILVGACLFAQTLGLFPGVLGLARRLQHGLSLLEQGARDLDRRIADYYRERGGPLTHIVHQPARFSGGVDRWQQSAIASRLTIP
jgi:hypothetical protein